MFPDRSKEIEIHKRNAKNFVKQKEFDKARQSFFSYVESVRQQNKNTDGKLEKDLARAQKEYSDFARPFPKRAS